MFRPRLLIALFTAAMAVTSTAAWSQNRSAPDGEATLHIDIPTRLEKATVVVDYGHAVYQGDALFALGDINLLASDLQEWHTNGKIVVVFHGDAAYLVLNDDTYNANRHVTTGNPFKGLLSSLIDRGVQLELCGATASSNHWTNANLLSGVKVNVNAMVRITELEQKGYTLIYQ